MNIFFLMPSRWNLNSQFISNMMYNGISQVQVAIAFWDSSMARYVKIATSWKTEVPVFPLFQIPGS